MGGAVATKRRPFLTSSIRGRTTRGSRPRDARMTHRPQRSCMRDERLLEPETTGHVIGAFFDVYNKLGFGFLEHVYAEALQRELRKRARKVRREQLVEIWYGGELLTRQRVDMIVDDKVLVEIKSTPVLPPTAQRQLLNYLRATTLQVGIVLHFGPEPRFYRKIHTHKEFRADAEGGESSRPSKEGFRSR